MHQQRDLTPNSTVMATHATHSRKHMEDTALLLPAKVLTRCSWHHPGTHMTSTPSSKLRTLSLLLGFEI